MSYPRTASTPSTHLPIRSRSEVSACHSPAAEAVFNEQRRQPSNQRLNAAKQLALVAIGAIALSLMAFIPAQVGSKSIDTASCKKKILPTEEISRGQMSALLALPVGSNQEAVRRVTGDPYCLLPAVDTETAAASSNKILAGAEREAYPLAFDPEAWVVVAYSASGEYIGYDFVFRP